MEDETSARSPRVWALHLDRAGDVSAPRVAQTTQQFLCRGEPTGDLARFSTKADIYRQLLTYYGSKRSNSAINAAAQFWSFSHEIKPGDFIVIAEVGETSSVAIGEVRSGYRYHPERSSYQRHGITVEWIRTGLDRSAIQPDLRANLGSLLSVRELAENNAAFRIAQLAAGHVDPGPEAVNPRAELAEALNEAATRAATDPPEPLELDISELLELWGHQQRSDTAISEIKRDLLQSGLTTVPPFTEGDLDRKVKLVAIPVEGPQRDETDADNAEAEETEDLAQTESIALRIGNFPFRTKPISTETLFEEARHIMVSKRYSQLAVVDGDGIYRGAITADRIIRAHMTPGTPTLAEVLDDQIPTAHRDDYLLSKLDLIFEHGFVFVHSHDRKTIDGILTAADLTRRFGAFMRPLTVLEEIENRLRDAIDKALSLKEIQKNTRRKSADVHSAADLFMGDYWYILKDPKYWDRLAWGLSQTMFLDQLQAVIDVRNSIMHFSSDPISNQQLDTLQEFREVISSVVPRR
jgi:restriction system protein